MKRWIIFTAKFLLLASLCAGPLLANAAEQKKLAPAEKRARIDAEAKDALSKLLAESKEAKELYDKSYGYAAFITTKVSLGLSGGGGGGEAVVKSTGKKTYMKMGLGGAGLALGAHQYQVVFLFQTREVFDNFVEKGFEGGAGASLVAGKEGSHRATAFRNGIAVYMFTKQGLVASADVTGSMFWKDKELN